MIDFGPKQLSDRKFTRLEKNRMNGLIVDIGSNDLNFTSVNID